MAIDLTVNDNPVVPLSVESDNGTDFQHSEAYIYAISPSAKVEESEDGATITIKDKDGETVVVLHNGKDGADGAQGPKGDTGERGPQGPPGSNADIIRFLPVDSASRAVASFTDGADDIPLKSLVVGINPIQSGSGDPSPTNVRPISGWTSMTVNANGTEIPISWENEAGTVYGGSLDVLNGVLTVDRTTDDMGNLKWDAQGSAGRCYSMSKRATIKKGTSKEGYDNAFAEIYSAGNVVSMSGLQANQMSVDRGGNIQLYDTRFAGMTGAQIKAELQGVTMCYKLEEPITYQLTPHEVKSLLGSNTIYADTGDTSVEYRADIQRYIDKRLLQ